jgi:hypothetical protein
MYLMRCLLCEPGTHWNPPEPRGLTDFIAMREHLIAEHGATPDDLQRQRSVLLAPGTYEYMLPGGRAWLRAKKMEKSGCPTCNSPGPHQFEDEQACRLNRGPCSCHDYD